MLAQRVNYSISGGMSNEVIQRHPYGKLCASVPARAERDDTYDIVVTAMKREVAKIDTLPITADAETFLKWISAFESKLMSIGLERNQWKVD